MRGSRRSVTGLVLSWLVLLAGCSGGDGGTDAAPSPVPGTVYAPYVSADTASDTDSAGSPAAYNLAFVISADGDCVPSWDGVHDIGTETVASRIAGLRKSGADVRVSFGGASGEELGAVCDSAEALAEAYGTALDAAGTDLADFDIEGDELSDSASVDRRSEAIALLREERGELEVSFTLPVMPSGLDEHGLALLESAGDHGVDVTTVNIMTMNYGESYDGDMGEYALASARAAHGQLREVFGLSSTEAWRGLAITSMLGVNDVEGETFTLADAAEVRGFAEEKGVAWVSMWSAFRDKECGEGASEDNPLTNCSGVSQGDGAFGEAFSG
ncbi:chitinase [Streptomyces sp. NPDC048584]|uniref:chitinase n=1 Tax=Streptomyces sp. NPDC048584 TaxID=3365573 RepID=UPI0037142B25